MNTLKVDSDKHNQTQNAAGVHFSMRRFCLSSNGFSLMEILIAMTIFSIGIMGVAKMQLSSVSGNASARVVADSVVQTSSRIESLLLLPYDHADLVEGTHAGAAMAGYTLSWTVVDDFPVPSNKRITVTVTPLGIFKDRSYTIEQIKSEIN